MTSRIILSMVALLTLSPSFCGGDAFLQPLDRGVSPLVSDGRDLHRTRQFLALRGGGGRRHPRISARDNNGISGLHCDPRTPKAWKEFIGEIPTLPPKLSEGQEIQTGGLGSLTFGNIGLDGKEVGMIYENAMNDQAGSSTLFIGNKRAVIQDKQGSRVIEDMWETSTDKDEKLSKGRDARRGAVYFETSKSGSWKQVPVPKGMTDKQLLSKLEKQEQFRASLSPEQRKVFDDEMNYAANVARTSGLKTQPITGECNFIAKRLKEKAKKKERSRRRFELKQRAVSDDIEARAKERDANRRNKGRRGWAGKDDSEVKHRRSVKDTAKKGGMRATAMGGTRKARRTGRKGRGHQRGRGGKRRAGKGGKGG